MPYYRGTALPQLQPAVPVSNGQSQLHHLSRGQDLLTVEVSTSSGDVIQQSLSSQQRSDRISSCNVDYNVGAEAASAQKCHSQLHHTSVSYLV